MSLFPSAQFLSSRVPVGAVAAGVIVTALGVTAHAAHVESKFEDRFDGLESKLLDIFAALQIQILLSLVLMLLVIANSS